MVFHLRLRRSTSHGLLPESAAIPHAVVFTRADDQSEFRRFDAGHFPPQTMRPATPPALEATAPPKPSAWPIKDYIAIARLDHWTKNLFMLPGLFLGMVFAHKPFAEI